ncbi:MAG: ABC transporter ATP-binding protein [Candidatus Bipolaricaulia bacterium]
MASVTLEHITKKFGTVVAVNDLNLEIENGEFIALLGPSGCGKTTTLLMLAGIYQPTEGSIYFDKTVINDVAPKHRYIGLVFQSYALYPHMSVYNNIAFPLKLSRTDKSETRQRVAEVAKLVRIEELMDRRPGQLSGGQQQRVALCRALVKEPQLLLLDEPLSNLDARLRIETRAEIKRLQKELDITSILVTHDQVEAMTMANRVAVMDEGVLHQYTTPEDLYSHPKNLFVASFIGDPPMNLADVTYHVEDGKFQLESENFSLAISKQIADRIEERGSRELVLGIRPDDIALERKDQDGDGSFPGEVYVTEPLGGGTLVDFKFGDLSMRALVEQNYPAEIGDRLWLVPQLERIHLFDRQTGESVLS